MSMLFKGTHTQTLHFSHVDCTNLIPKIPNFDEGMKWCGSALELDPSLVDVLCDRAELYISNEMYDEAINDYQTANSHNDQYQRVSFFLSSIIYFSRSVHSDKRRFKQSTKAPQAITKERLL